MRFKIDFTSLPSIEVEMDDVALAEAFAMYHCTMHGMDPSTGQGPLPLQIVRLPDPVVCPECGYSADLYADHNTERGWFCNNCLVTFEEKR